MNRQPTPLWQPRRGIWLGLTLMLILAAAPHLWRMHALASVAWLGIVGWCLRRGLQGQPPPRLPVRAALLIAASLFLYSQHGTLVGRDAGAALLVMMLALKFLELRTPRDATILVYLCYFLICVQFLFTQHIPTAFYLLGTALVITAVWIELSDPLGGQPWRTSARLAANLLVQALPLMLILFLLFPRIPGPLWRLPHDAHSGVTGLSNHMEPGRISQLVNSEEIAFRVQFPGPVPPPAERYWRGPVFEVSDGRRWTPATLRPGEAQPFTPGPRGPGLEHTVTLEPHGTRSLLALDRPGHGVPDGHLQRDFQLLARRPLDSRRRYQVTSYQAFELTPDAASLERSRRVPPLTSARMRSLAADWRQAADAPRQIIDAALQFFHERDFVYTLSPPRLGAYPMDEFLFETRRGFCEHYAAAFVTLMRAAGLPARVVTGYLGGEFNAVGDYLVVRQSDAHAWAEVWLPDEGWVRVDPTAAIAPQRIEQAIDLTPLREGAPVTFRLARDGRWIGISRQLAQYWDAVNNGWNQWVLGYSPDLQRDFLGRLGLPDVSWRGLGSALGVAAALAMAMNLLWVLRRHRRRADPVERLYARLRRKLGRRGLRIRPSDGPCTLARRAAAELTTTQAMQVDAAIAEYIRLRYAGRGPVPSVQRLRALVAAVR